MRPERGSAARFTRFGNDALPPIAAFQGLVRATPLLPMAPERRFRGLPAVPVDRPASILRRLLLLQYASGTDANGKLRDLESSGLFVQVGLVPARPTRVNTAQVNSEPLGQTNPDVHRWQWALEHVRAHDTPGGPGAWQLTPGRAMVGSIDRGVMTTHPDLGGPALVNLPLGNFRKHVSARILSPGGFGAAVVRPEELGLLGTPPHSRMPPHHGTHVNTLMAAPINGTGIAGVCPRCTLQTFRAEFDREFPLATIFAGRFGLTALNLSFEPTPIGTNKFFDAYRLALLDLIGQDLVVIAAAGNQRTPRESWNVNGLPTPPNPTVPHSIPSVMKIGATDFDRRLWDESRIVALLDAGRRHPVAEAANLCAIPNELHCVPGVIWSRCANPLGADQCGSSFGVFNGIIDLVAPGAQVIAGMDHPSQPQPQPPPPWLLQPGVYSPVPPHPENLFAWPPAEVGLGVSQGLPGQPPAGVAVRQTVPAQLYWGPMTGTSQAAPHVTAAAGLMRSINPLLSATAVRTGLRDGANENVPEYTRPRMGDGLLDARKSVELAAGRIRGTVLQNRLVPMFAMYAAQSQNPEESAESEVLSPPVPIHAWLYTTNPQLASAAMKTDIYVSNDPLFSPTTFAAYEHSHLLSLASLRKGIPIAPSVYELPSGAGTGFRNPAASFWVFTTPHSPLPGFSLQPLYRLTTDMTVESGSALLCAGDQRKHLYSTDVVEVTARTSAAHNCNLAPMLMRYHFESIEGYVYDRAGPQPPGSFPLFRVFNTNLGFNVAALVVQGESLPGYSSPGAADASNNPHFLGWVYRTFQPAQSGVGIEAADMDQDGLPNGVEIALGLNEQSANGDCEGPNDAVEYGFANLPDDPMSLTPNCVDGRVRVVRPNPNVAGEARVIFSNPAGPMAFPEGKALRVTFFQGGGWPTVIPPGCIYDDSEVGLSFKHYLCEIASALPASPGSMVEFVFQVEARTNPSPPPHQAVVRIPTGFTDPGIPSNNIATF